MQKEREGDGRRGVERRGKEGCQCPILPTPSFTPLAASMLAPLRSPSITELGPRAQRPLQGPRKREGSGVITFGNGNAAG